MIRPAFLLLLAGCAAPRQPSASAPPPPAERVPGPAPVAVPEQACFTPAEAAPWQQKIADWNSARMAEALAARGLRHAAVQETVQMLGGRGAAISPPVGTVQGNILYGQVGEACPGPPGWAFLVDGAGELFIVEYESHAVSHPVMKICGCDDYASYYPCGGAAPPLVRRNYVLPPGSHFGGQHVKITFDSIEPVAGFLSTTACPAPPPPPP